LIIFHYEETYAAMKQPVCSDRHFFDLQEMSKTHTYFSNSPSTCTASH